MSKAGNNANCFVKDTVKDGEKRYGSIIGGPAGSDSSPLL